MNKLKRTSLVILLSVCSSFAISQTKVGSTAAPFLNVAIGPRAIAMGGAFVATANDLTALYWNPAGVSRIGSHGALFAHTRWFADISYNWVGAEVSLQEYGNVGISLTYLNYGKMEVTTLREQDGTGEFFSAHDLALGLTYAYNMTDRFSLGMSLKYVNQQIWNSSAEAFAVDVGTLFYSDIYGIRLGAAMTNFGTKMQLDGKDLFVLHDVDPTMSGNNDQILAQLKTNAYPLPLMFRVGIAKDFSLGHSDRLTVGMDAQHPNDNAESINVGGEYVFQNIVSLRGGYKSFLTENSEEGLTLGLGLRHQFSQGFTVSLDYAYQDFGILKSTQHFAVSIYF